MILPILFPYLVFKPISGRKKSPVVIDPFFDIGKSSLLSNRWVKKLLFFTPASVTGRLPSSSMYHMSPL